MTLPSRRHEHTHKLKPRRRKSVCTEPENQTFPVCSASSRFHHLNSHKTIPRVFTGDAATRRVTSKSQKGGNHLIAHKGFSVSVFRAADACPHVSPFAQHIPAVNLWQRTSLVFGLLSSDRLWCSDTQKQKTWWWQIANTLAEESDFNFWPETQYGSHENLNEKGHEDKKQKRNLTVS